MNNEEESHWFSARQNDALALSSWLAKLKNKGFVLSLKGEEVGGGRDLNKGRSACPVCLYAQMRNNSGLEGECLCKGLKATSRLTKDRSTTGSRYEDYAMQKGDAMLNWL